MPPEFTRLTMPAGLDSLQPLTEFVLAGADRAGLAQSERDKLELVLEELLVNVARYAYQPEPGDVEVAYAADKPGELLVEISDKGRFFNPLEVPTPDLSTGLVDRPIGGLGLFLVRSLAGSVAYRREQDRNTVSFRFPGPQRPGT
ncbi:MAG TPA: ATP-binding protein [Bryobacteraceae bacterium]|nr:ATP-binding protein [Bryobacteraceae bacterium]